MIWTVQVDRGRMVRETKDGEWRMARISLAIRHSPLPAVLLILLVTVLAALHPRPLQAHDPSLHPAQVLAALGFEQQLGAQAPLELHFRNEQGRAVRLGDYFGEQPVILTLGYFTCPQLCPLVREELFAGLQEMRLTAGDEFTVVAVSIDPTEGPQQANRAKLQQLAHYDRPGAEAGIHFLTGDHDTIDKLAEAVGFHYAYDSRQGQYAHPSGVVILTPAGEIARYLFGLDYPARDLRLALVEAAAGQIGTVIDRVMLFCYHYDPISGQYNLLVMNLLRLSGLATVIALAGGVWLMLRRERLRIGY
jgi:protein SCO1